MKRPAVVFTYRGPIERGNGKPGYNWRPGYSETTPGGLVVYPWQTYRECQAEAKARGCRAIFIKGGAA